MKTERTGIIIFTENFKTLKNFYQEIFNFPELFDAQWEENEELVCLDTGSGYLLIETPQGQDITHSPIPPLRIRLHVENVVQFSKHLESINIEHSYAQNPWGESIQFQDPDNNHIHIRDEATFLE